MTQTVNDRMVRTLICLGGWAHLMKYEVKNLNFGSVTLAKPSEPETRYADATLATNWGEMEITQHTYVLRSFRSRHTIIEVLMWDGVAPDQRLPLFSANTGRLV